MKNFPVLHKTFAIYLQFRILVTVATVLVQSEVESRGASTRVAKVIDIDARMVAGKIFFLILTVVILWNKMWKNCIILENCWFWQNTSERMK